MDPLVLRGKTLEAGPAWAAVQAGAKLVALREWLQSWADSITRWMEYR